MHIRTISGPAMESLSIDLLVENEWSHRPTNKQVLQPNFHEFGFSFHTILSSFEWSKST